MIFFKLVESSRLSRVQLQQNKGRAPQLCSTRATVHIQEKSNNFKKVWKFLHLNLATFTVQIQLFVRTIESGKLLLTSGCMSTQLHCRQASRKQNLFYWARAQSVSLFFIRFSKFPSRKHFTFRSSDCPTLDNCWSYRSHFNEYDT